MVFGESTGMGLYIVKTVCDNLGHKIEIKSEIEKVQVSILFENQYYKLLILCKKPCIK